MNAQRQEVVPANSPFTPVRSSLLQRKCHCGGSAGLTGECDACKSKKQLGQPMQTMLRINEPGDEFEQEADRIAEQVMRMADGSYRCDNRSMPMKVRWEECPFCNVQRRVPEYR
jgi:hypothetical protein